MQASNDEMAVEVEENVETPLNEGSVHSTEPLQNTGCMNSQEEVVKVDGIFDFNDLLFDNDFACFSGQETAAAGPDYLINVIVTDHTYASFPAGDGSTENNFLQELAAGEIFQDSLEPSLHTPERVVLDCDSVRNYALFEEASAGPSGVRSQTNGSLNSVVAHSATNYNLTGVAGPSGEQDTVTSDCNLSDEDSGSNTPAELESSEPIKKTRPCRRRLHKDFNIKRKEITPHKAALWKEVKELRKRNKALSKKYEKLLSKHKNPQPNGNAILSSLQGKVSSDLFMCLRVELVNFEKKGPSGKRWTFDMKCFALAVFKQSPKTYRFLRGMFNLPGESILKEVLYSIPFETGFNPALANKLKHDVPLLEAPNTYVAMSCDEMALRKGLYYENRHRVNGFVDYGSGRTTGEVADHALQFMINWLGKPLKEVVATYFTRNTCPTNVLKVLISANVACL